MKNLVLAAIFLAVVSAADAQTRTPRTNTRQAAQQARIQEGKRSGELTQNETQALRAEQQHIRRAERRAKADGEVTVAERRKLERKQDRSSRHIRRAKNNAADTN